MSMTVHLGDVSAENYIDQKIAERTAAKKNRDFATADRIRDELKADGIQLLDRADGTTDWERA
jgi:cysteinyl-tRNA synthetase